MYKNLKDYSTSDKRKIGIFAAFKKGYYFTSTYIRILSPLNDLSDEFEFVIIDYDTRKSFMKDLDENLTCMDAIIISRDIDIMSHDLDFVKSFYRKLKRNGIKIIFDIDDNIMSMDEDHTEYEYYRKLFEYFTFLIENSDIIIASTHRLKEDLSKYNDNIEVVENTLMDLWQFDSTCDVKDLTSKKTIKIGYFGTRTHSNDLKMLEAPIKNVRKHFPDKNIEFEVIGVAKEKEDWFAEIPLPNNYRKNPGLIDRMLNFAMTIVNRLNLIMIELPYLQFIRWVKNETDWDIGLAPLEDNRFNRNKSNLKYLEYGAMNVAGVFSNVEPYYGIKSKNSGLVVQNTPDDWQNALISLIEDKELYESVVLNSRKDIGENYLVSNSSRKWREILKKFI